MTVKANYRLNMVTNRFTGLGESELTEGFYIRQAGTEFRRQWVQVAYRAGEFSTYEASLQRYDLEFEKANEQTVRDRVFYLCNDENEAIGTATAWFHQEQKQLGRLHFVALMDKYQGKGLIRPLLEATLSKLQQLHEDYWLTTQPRSMKGIKLYLDYGFLPVVENEEDNRVWKHLFNKLGRNWTPGQSRTLSSVRHPDGALSGGYFITGPENSDDLSD